MIGLSPVIRTSLIVIMLFFWMEWIFFFFLLQEVREEEEEDEDIDSLVNFHKRAMATSSSSLSSSKVKLLTFSAAPAGLVLSEEEAHYVSQKGSHVRSSKKIIYNLRPSSGKFGNA